MKKQILCLFLSLILLSFLTSCKNTEKSMPMDENSENKSSLNTDSVSEPDGKESAASLNIEVGDQSFVIILYDNPSTQALLELLPLDLDMSEMNGNEKYFSLPDVLPTDSKNVESIQQGDFMLYGDNCLVLFYKDFSTSYRYTPLGRIDNPEGFAAAVGGSDVRIKFYQPQNEGTKTTVDTQDSDTPVPDNAPVTKPDQNSNRNRNLKQNLILNLNQYRNHRKPKRKKKRIPFVCLSKGQQFECLLFRHRYDIIKQTRHICCMRGAYYGNQSS